jgi:SAM-dependent methyltransferase
MPENRPYRLLARYYDEFFTSHIPEYQRARRRLLRHILPDVQSACDLACGTGTTAIELARRGIKVFAVDLSPTMCRLARSKARSAGVHIVVIRGDMRTFSLSKPVDLVTCEYDAVNHLPCKADLARTARAVARALRPGGYFYFDVNNRRHLEKNWPGTHWSERSGRVMVMRGRYDRGSTKGVVDLEWFIREATRWRRFHEHVEEVWWTASEIRQTLHGAGFEHVRSWDARRFSGQHQLPPGCRTFFLAQSVTQRP